VGKNRPVQKKGKGKSANQKFGGSNRRFTRDSNKKSLRREEGKKYRTQGEKSVHAWGGGTLFDDTQKEKKLK